MPRIKIEDILPTGERISIVLEGQEVSERRVLQVLEMLKIMSGRIGGEADAGDDIENQRLGDIIWDAIVEFFGDGRSFTSRELYDVLVKEYGLNIKLNAVATYLLRFYRRGMLKRVSRGRYGIRYVVARIRR